MQAQQIVDTFVHYLMLNFYSYVSSDLSSRSNPPIKQKSKYDVDRIARPARHYYL